jgi:hypothetical protein
VSNEPDVDGTARARQKLNSVQHTAYSDVRTSCLTFDKRVISKMPE